MGELVTDRDVDEWYERWLARRSAPAYAGKPSAGGHRGGIWPLFEGISPAGPLRAPAEKRKAYDEAHPPSPVRVLMKDGVWLDGRENRAGAECSPVVSPCGDAAGLAPATDQLRADCSAEMSYACAGEMMAPAPDVTATGRVRKKSSIEWQREWTARGLCRTCVKPFTLGGPQALYCEPCRERRNAANRRRWASKKRASGLKDRT